MNIQQTNTDRLIAAEIWTSRDGFWSNVPNALDDWYWQRDMGRWDSWQFHTLLLAFIEAKVFTVTDWELDLFYNVNVAEIASNEIDSQPLYDEIERQKEALRDKTAPAQTHS